MHAIYIEPLAGLLSMFAMVTSSGRVNNQYQCYYMGTSYIHFWMMTI